MKIQKIINLIEGDIALNDNGLSKEYKEALAEAVRILRLIRALAEGEDDEGE